MPSDTYDAFLTHAKDDAPWAKRLATALGDAGVRVFLDAWELRPGTVRVHERERGLQNARDGIVVVSPASMAEPWVHMDYAVLLERAVKDRRLLVPVLLTDAEMPAFLSAFHPVDFRGPAGEPGPLFDARVADLVRALRDEKRRPAPTPEDGTGYRLGGTLYRRLAVDRERAVLYGGEAEVGAEVGILDAGTEERLWQLWRAFNQRSSGDLLRETASPADAVREAAVRLHRRQLEAGHALACVFLPDTVAAALSEDLGAASRSGSTLELALEVEDELVHLPWETLCLPGADEPLVLDPRVHLYRSLSGVGPATTWSIPGPLRVLVAIGSPEAQNARGELLDMERELQLVLDAVEPARRQGGAFVKVIERGTVDAIRQALEAERYHVLHLSCHAGPGVLILEDDEGGEHKVTAEELWNAIPSGRGVPFVVLAGCSTALDEKTDDDERRYRPGLARVLLEHGVPAVAAMQAPVGDRYATHFVSSIYRGLATAERPEPLRALAWARRRVEELRRRDEDAVGLAEWSVPVLFLRRPEKGTAADLPLYDPAVPFDEIRLPTEAVFAPGVVARQVGEFVGRRREQRRLLRKLRDSGTGAVVVRGLGGAGKSTLAAELARTLARDGWIVASVVGETSPEDVLEELGSTFFSLAVAQGLDERDPLRQISGVLRQRNVDWADRLRLLTDHVLGQLPLLLLLDNFEDNLTDDAAAFRNDDLGAFLHGWLARPGQSRLLGSTGSTVPSTGIWVRCRSRRRGS